MAYSCAAFGGKVCYHTNFFKIRIIVSMGRVWFWFKSPARWRYSNLRSCPWIPSQKNAKYFLRRQKIFSGLALAEWEGLRTGPRGWGDGAWAGGWAGRGRGSSTRCRWKLTSIFCSGFVRTRLLSLGSGQLDQQKIGEVLSPRLARYLPFPGIVHPIVLFDTKVRRTVLLPWHTLFYSRALQRCRWLTKCYL